VSNPITCKTLFCNIFKGHRVLILPISTPNRGFRITSNNELEFEADATGATLLIPLTGRLEEDILLFPGRHNTQPILRALKPHLHTAEHIWLIGSTAVDEHDKETGSQPHLALIKQLITHYLKPGITIHESLSGINFEDIETMYEKISQCANEARKQWSYSDHDIIIDTTGGQKTTSIAASLATLHNNISFQYVQSSKPFEVNAYDMIFDSHPHLRT